MKNIIEFCSITYIVHIGFTVKRPLEKKYGEGQQNVYICSALTAYDQGGGFLSCYNRCDTEPVFSVSFNAFT